MHQIWLEVMDCSAGPRTSICAGMGWNCGCAMADDCFGARGRPVSVFLVGNILYLIDSLKDSCAPELHILL